MKYTVIKTEEQYEDYCVKLEQLLDKESNTKNINDEIELLTLLIEKWDDEHDSMEDATPIELLHSLMAGRNLKARDLLDILGVSKGMVSDILNCKKGLSKEVIGALSAFFKVRQEAFNRPYKLITPINSHLRNASVMNTHKEMA